jgi:hypothetical protein
MNCQSHIRVADYFHHQKLVTREVAEELAERIASVQCYFVFVDFSGIDFISRSFADQFHKEKLRLWEAGLKEVSIEGASQAVLEMFKAVSQSAEGKAVRHTRVIPIVQRTDRATLKQFLEGL